MHITTTVLGYPRIGPNRELKKALEGYWGGSVSAASLQSTADALQAEVFQTLAQAGIDQSPSNTFSFYDHVLDMAVAVDAIPDRYRALGLSDLDTYFAMARGNASVAPLELTKWFNTNYHYLVPELDAGTVFKSRIRTDFPSGTRPVLVGPVTFLLQSKPAKPGFDVLDLLDPLLACYETMFAELAAAGVEWVQLDEPAFVCDRTGEELAALSRAYRRLGALNQRPKLLVAGYFGGFGDALPILLGTPTDGIALDLVAGRSDVEVLAAHGRVRDKLIVAGLVDGRNVWRTDLSAAARIGATLLGLTDQLGVSTSCSLMHVPVDLSAETELDPALVSRLAFARQKVDEVVALGAILRGEAAVPAPLDRSPHAGNPSVRARLSALRQSPRHRSPYQERAAAQSARLPLPELPTTTIGSFPQTDALRAARAQLRSGALDPVGYRQKMKDEIASVIALQERLGLDVLVHGEPERNDMVQYFAESFDGCAATQHGWVQSYGSRCVRPPIIYGDVSRPEPITVEWISYAQSLTERPVKGMLTGPVTILAWSFVRDDQPLSETAAQVALALRDESHDLEMAGIRIIQVDEPALRELLPLRRSEHASYLAWAVEAFRLATSGVADSTQIHTHLCYSEFGEVLPAIEALDADVTSIEASRSKMEVLPDLGEVGYSHGIGPGIYDIHSPRVPSVDEMATSLGRALMAVPAKRLWVNPDCGLKTRRYKEVEPALANLVAAATAVRSTLD